MFSSSGGGNPKHFFVDNVTVVTSSGEEIVLETSVNQEALPGSIWVEEADLHWTNGSHEFSLDNVTSVGSNTADKGSLWVENSSIRWIDSFGLERRYRGLVFEESTAASPGSLWVENDFLHYVDVQGVEREADGS